MYDARHYCTKRHKRCVPRNATLAHAPRLRRVWRILARL